jgi:L-fucose mutarotase
MLKKIPRILSPDLFKILMEMGHGDEIVLADGNFPSKSCASRYLIRCDGHGIPELLDAILEFLPLDKYVKAPAVVTEIVPGDPVVPVIWEEYKKILAGREGAEVKVEEVERFAFYERAKKAYAIVATSERSLYANIILKKGVIK